MDEGLKSWYGNQYIVCMSNPEKIMANHIPLILENIEVRLKYQSYLILMFQKLIDKNVQFPLSSSY